MDGYVNNVPPAGLLDLWFWNKVIRLQKKKKKKFKYQMKNKIDCLRRDNLIAPLERTTFWGNQ